MIPRVQKRIGFENGHTLLMRTRELASAKFFLPQKKLMTNIHYIDGCPGFTAALLPEIRTSIIHRGGPNQVAKRIDHEDGHYLAYVLDPNDFDEEIESYGLLKDGYHLYHELIAEMISGKIDYNFVEEMVLCTELFTRNQRQLGEMYGSRMLTEGKIGEVLSDSNFSKKVERVWSMCQVTVSAVNWYGPKGLVVLLAMKTDGLSYLIDENVDGALDVLKLKRSNKMSGFVARSEIKRKEKGGDIIENVFKIILGYAEWNRFIIETYRMLKSKKEEILV